MKGRGALVLVAALALAARAGFELVVRADDGPVGALATHLLGDERAYDEFARRSAAGTLQRTRAFYQEPLYAWLLGRLYTLAPPAPLDESAAVVPQDGVHLAVIAVQHLLGVLVALLTAVLGTRALGRRAGLLAGLAAALSGPAIFHEAMLLKESLALAVLLVALLLWLDLLVAEAPRRGRALLTGAVLGGGVLLRGNLYLLVGLALLSLLLPLGSSRRRPLEAGLLLLGCLLALLPVTLHNLRLGDVVLTTYQSGTNAALGQPDSDAVVAGVVYEPLREGRGDARYEEADAVAFAEAAAGRRLSGHEISAWWWRQVAQRVAERPGVAAARVGLKLAHLFHPREVPDVKEWDVFAAALPWLASPLSTEAVVGPWALLGFLCLPWRRRPGLLVVRSVVLVVAATLAIFYVLGRYRLTALPALWILAAGAVDAGLTVLAGPAAWWRRGLVVLVGIGLPVLAALVPLPPAFEPGTVSLANAATIARHAALTAPDAESARRQRDLAVLWARRSLERAPLFPSGHATLLRALLLHRPDLPARADEARAQAWRLELVLEGLRTGVDVSVPLAGDEAEVRRVALALLELPSRPGGEEFAGPLLAEAGLALVPGLRADDELPVALRVVERAARLDPDDPGALVERGVVLRRLGRLAEAEASYRAAMAAGDDSVELHNNLGNLLLLLGRPAEAVPELERALELAPEHELVRHNLERARAAASGEGER